MPGAGELPAGGVGSAPGGDRAVGAKRPRRDALCCETAAAGSLAPDGSQELPAAFLC